MSPPARRMRRVRLAARAPSTRSCRHKVAIVVDALRRTAKLPDADVRAQGVGAVRWATARRSAWWATASGGRRSEWSARTTPVPPPGAWSLILAGGADRPPSSCRPELEVTLARVGRNRRGDRLWDHRRSATVDGLPPHVGVGPKAALDGAGRRTHFRVSAGSFFQSGPAAAELLVAAVRAAAPELARRGGCSTPTPVSGCSRSRRPRPPRRWSPSRARGGRSPTARVNLRSGGRGSSAGGRVAGVPARARRFDVVIADPARTGLGKPGRQALARGRGAGARAGQLRPGVALARDAALLAGHGYRHDRHRRARPVPADPPRRGRHAVRAARLRRR